MPIRFNTLFNLTEEQLDEKGVFNGFIDVDARFHVDPALLPYSSTPELEKAYEKFQEHFKKVITLVDNSESASDRFWREALKHLQFKEKDNILLGYSIGDNHGSAIGINIASQLLKTTKELTKAGIKDPIIFELVGLFEEGIGADRVSDMTISIIFDDLINYTVRVAKELGIKTLTFKKGESEFLLPQNPRNGKAIIFVPSEILRTLPVAYCWDDIDRVARYNMELRNQVNKIIGNNWKKAVSSRVRKSDLKATILNHPELINDLVSQYKEKPKEKYDFKGDPSGEIIWAEAAESATKEHPLNLEKYKPATSDNIFQIVSVICNQFAHLIEDNGHWEFLYDEQGNLRNERFPQKLFYGVADSYCRANDLDLSREPNAGSGALDFKISRGYHAKVTVEVKYSSNNHLYKGYSKQLPVYNKAENAEKSIYLVIQTKRHSKVIKNLLKLEKQHVDKNEKAPKIIIIDGQIQVSASKK
jgi:hypothetical protein